MIKNYFKTAYRTLTLHKTYSITNIVGLTVGLLAFMLISTIVIDHYSYDRHWKNSNQLYRITSEKKVHDQNFSNKFESAPKGISAKLKTHFSEIIHYSSVESRPLTLQINKQKKQIAEIKILETDSNFFHLIDIQTIAGNPKQTVAHAKNITITESVYQKYFKGEVVVGKVIDNIPFDGKPEPYYINAVIKDFPHNTYLHTEAIVVMPIKTGMEIESNGGLQMQFLLLKPTTNIASFTGKINQWNEKHNLDNDSKEYNLELQSIKDIHLSITPRGENPKKPIYILIAIGILIIVLVSFNYINLSFAHALKRTQQIGIRKVLGASQKHLIIQMSVESMLLFGSAFVMAFLCYAIILPAFEKYVGNPLTMTYIQSAVMSIVLLFCWILLGLLCSLIPSLSFFNTKISLGLKKQLSLLRLPLNMGFTKILIVIQFTIAIVVAICMMTMHAQLQHIYTKDLGYQPKNLLLIDYVFYNGNHESFKQELLKYPAIESVGNAMWTPFSGSVDFHTVDDPSNSKTPIPVIFFYGDYDYLKTMGIKLIAGREMSKSYASDALQLDSLGNYKPTPSNMLVSASTAKRFDLKLNETNELLKKTPVGIFEDFNGASLKFPQSPAICFIAIDNWQQGSVVIRVKEGKHQEAREIVQTALKQFFPDQIVRVNWMDELVYNQYKEEEKQFQQLAFFTMVSILISLLGILGIAIYTIERRIKEIGIRKVLGATAASIIYLISRTFIILILIAMIIAFPIAWWLMRHWLNEFAYRIDIPILLFGITGLFILIGTMILVGFRIYRATTINPVSSLRDE